ncbi:MAG: sensor domain-containing diguanylate cyclase [Pyrinomonadaceae bacterium]|nr:sensor domain-containing diguanylate cyclase [Pyrinomonadaceae bacterium]
MTRHVVLLTDAHEAPAPQLVETLREAGLVVFIEGLREAEVAARVALHEMHGAAFRYDAPQPVVVLYEVHPGTSTVELHAVREHVQTIWPRTPLVACRHKANGSRATGARVLDNTALKRLGFRVIADEPAQLPVLLRDLEDKGGTGELSLPRSQTAESEFLTGALLLPQKLKTKSLRSAFEVVASLHFAADQKSAAHTTLVGLAPLVQADRWAIYLTADASGGEAQTLEPLAVRGLTTSEREIPEKDWRRALMGESLALFGSESEAAKGAARSMETIRRSERGRRIVAVPLISNERVFGVLEAVREGKGGRAFSKADVALLDALALPIASALANSVRIAEAEKLSQTDDLTKLHNARYLRQYLTNEIKRARRYNSSVAAIFLDLDDFKRINDMHGHLVGSHVLMEMAAVILASVRDTDAVARYGGDEFVVVLPETNMEQAERVASRLREKTEQHEFTGGRRLQLKLTASFGVAAFPEHAQSPQQLVASADTAMYEAKAAHKNCIRLAQAPASLKPKD